MEDRAPIFGKVTELTKIEKYGWTLKDVQGEMALLHKHKLNVHTDYQRHAIESKIQSIASSWSWIACGAIIIAHRDGEYWVIDGQHRVVAANKRADITYLPCVIFQTESVEQEARGFLDANTGRKPVSSIDKFKALLAANDEIAIYVDSVFKEFGIIPKPTAMKPKEIKSVAWALDRAKNNRLAFKKVIKIASELCEHCTITEVLLDGLYYLDVYHKISLNDKRLLERIKKIGASRLVDAAKRASAYYTAGGAKIWADGMLTEINKGLRDKYEASK